MNTSKKSDHHENTTHKKPFPELLITGEPITYSDGAENALLDFFKSNDVDEYDLHLSKNHWAPFYHLSPIRKNLINWINLGTSPLNVLEIGAGCGAITSELVKHDNLQITALEGSLNRAKAIQYRCKNSKNLKIIVDNITNYKPDEHFDLVLLVGVLEYAGMYDNSETPFLDLLKKSQKCLKPNGTLLLAIENQFGHKYLAGFPEDHYGSPYEGINGYPNYNGVRTFDEDALREKLSNAGFMHQHWFFPYPDYKLPKIIINEDAFKQSGFDIFPFLDLTTTDYSTKAQPTFNERAFLKSMHRAGQATRFMNSFLILASPSTQHNSLSLNEEILVAKTNVDGRGKQFQTQTRFMLDDENHIFVERLHLHKLPIETFSSGKHVIDNQESYHTNHSNLEELILDNMTDNDFKSASDHIIRWHDQLINLSKKEQPEYRKAFDKFCIHHLGDTIYSASSNEWLDGKYLDLHPGNILISDQLDENKIIDLEWHLNIMIPLQLVLDRGIRVLADNVRQLSNLHQLKIHPTTYLPLELMKKLDDLPMTQYSDMNSWELFENWFQQVVIRGDFNYKHDPKMLGTIFANQAIKANKSGKIQQAEYYFRKALDNCPDSTHTHHQYALLLSSIGKYQEAIQEILEILKTDARNYEKENGEKLRQIACQHSAARTRVNALVEIYHSALADSVLPLSRPNQDQLEYCIRCLQETKGYTENLASRKIVRAAANKTSHSPIVSIIIPVFNKLKYTRQCLETLTQNTPQMYEVVIVDNGSSDGTREFLSGIGGRIKILTNEENQGFARACNLGARAASGKYLIFLNNDTEVQPGWLEPMVSMIDQDPALAAVSCKMLFPDRPIQHAGVMLIDDRKLPDPPVGRHIYHGCPADHSETNQTRTYQALTAASFLVQKSAFDEVDGFDEHYWNGYEGVDLCFKLRQKGWLLAYQPRSVIIHHESQSEPERARANEELSARAEIALAAGRLDEAEELFKAALNHAPDAPRTLHQYAILRYSKGETNEAITLLERSLRGDPGNAEIMNDLGTLFYQTERKDRALALFNKAVDTDPDLIAARMNLADLHTAAGQTAKAENTYKEVLNLYPDNTEVLVALAILYKTMGRMDEEYDCRERMAMIERNQPLTALDTVSHMAPANDTGVNAHQKGICNICGSREGFLLTNPQNPRESWTCRSCGSTSRDRMYILALSRAFDNTAPLSSWPENADLHILEAAGARAHPGILKAKFSYLNTRYDPDIMADPGYDRTRYADFQALHFDDDSFDVVMSSDVFEHIRLYNDSLNEIFRVLKPGGIMVLQAPFHPENKENIVRVRPEGDKDVFLCPPTYHDENTLVYRVYGAEFIDEIKSAGFTVEVMEDEIPRHCITRQNIILAQKPEAVPVLNEDSWPKIVIEHRAEVKP